MKDTIEAAIEFARTCTDEDKILAKAVLKLAAEVDRLSLERDEAWANYQFMVNRAADERLDGYRELGQSAARAENKADALRAEISRLKAEISRLRAENLTEGTRDE